MRRRHPRSPPGRPPGRRPSLTRLRRGLARAALPVLLASVTPAGAQVAPDEARPGRVVSVTVRDGVTRSDEFHADLRPGDALDALRGVLASEPTRYDALWRAAREAVSLGMLADEDDEARGWFDDAGEFARRAVEARPDSAQGHQWLAIALGRQALLANPRDRVELSVRVRETARRTLELDPHSAGAHNVLGQWHAEIKRLSGITRFVAERLLGGETFREASWGEAERHLRRAVELEPEALVHRVALGRLYLDVDRTDEARHQLQLALDLPILQPTDPISRREARELLREIG